MTITPEELVEQLRSVHLNGALNKVAADTIEALTAENAEARSTIEVLLGDAKPVDEVLSSARRYSDLLAENARLTAENERLERVLAGTVLLKEDFVRQRDDVIAEFHLASDARDSARREADRYREQLERLEKAATTAMADQNNQGRVSAASRDALNDAIDNTLRALALPAVLVEERSTE